MARREAEEANKSCLALQKLLFLVGFLFFVVTR
jgi:hypothetical protein